MVNMIRGHLIDIDTATDSLRLRWDHLLRWDDQGRIESIAPSKSQEAPSAEMLPLIFPGFVDCHVHFPQANIIGGFGVDLLDWLNRNVWPEEKKFAQEEYARQTAKVFFNKLLGAGTTTAMIFGSQFKQANDFLFAHAEQNKISIHTGLTLQDRYTIPELELSLKEITSTTEECIERWHKVGRIRYTLTPRFSPACSPPLLQELGALMKRHDDLLLQTHINESASEIAFVSKLFPDAKDYLDTYDSFGLVTERSLFAHSIHPTQRELQRMGECKCSVAHCPSSNAFLGSGAFSFQAHEDHDIRVGLGSDVGAGLSFSLWDEMLHAHLMQMRHPFEQRKRLTGKDLLQLATIDGAKALHLEDQIGHFEAGKWADFFLMKQPASFVEQAPREEDLSTWLFQFALRQHEREVLSTYVAGKCLYSESRH